MARPTESYLTQRVSINSDPALMVKVINRLRKILRRRIVTAPIVRGYRSFFAGILRRKEGEKKA